MIAYLNGQFLPIAEARIPAWDYGFAMGVSLTERMRTYGGKLPVLDLHLNRMFAALDFIGLQGRVDREELTQVIESIVRHNLPNVPTGADLSIGVCLTPGPMETFAPAGVADTPTVLVTANELDVSRWKETYQSGVRLVTVGVREIPAECIPRSIKHRNRLHYYLAEKEAAEKSAGARALLLDTDGFVAEGTTASIVAIKNGRLLRPKSDKVLPSVSFEFTLPMFEELGINVVEQDFSVADFQAADEVLWFSSPMAVLPVSEIDGQKIGSGQRPVLASLLAKWSEATGTDLL